MARPKLQLDEGLIERLATIHCPITEIAAALDCSVDTLERNYAGLIAKGREKGKASLRRTQWNAAMKGNVVMMIWLGKQILKQTDKLETTLDAKVETLSSSERARIDEAKKMLQTMPNERDEKQTSNPGSKKGSNL